MKPSTPTAKHAALHDLRRDGHSLKRNDGSTFGIADSPQTALEIQACCNSHYDLVAACEAAVHALRSYQYGNGSPDLAEEIANKIQSALSAAGEKGKG